MVAEGLDIEDYHDVVNALTDGPSKPGRVTFDVRWRCRQKTRAHDPTNHFEGNYKTGSASIVWRGKTGEQVFRSGPASTAHTNFAEIGEERNGSFFS